MIDWTHLTSRLNVCEFVRPELVSVALTVTEYVPVLLPLVV